MLGKVGGGGGETEGKKNKKKMSKKKKQHRTATCHKTKTNETRSVLMLLRVEFDLRLPDRLLGSKLQAGKKRVVETEGGGGGGTEREGWRGRVKQTSKKHPHTVHMSTS